MNLAYLYVSKDKSRMKNQFFQIIELEDALQAAEDKCSRLEVTQITTC